MRKHLTNELIEALNPKAKKYVCYDAIVPALAVRVSPTGKKTFIVVGRVNGKKHPTRRSLGKPGRVSIDQARAKALSFDPKPTDKLAMIAERYFAHIKPQRRAFEIDRCIRRELLPLWGEKQIGTITKRDVVDVIEAIKARGAPSTARHTLSYATRLFNYAIARDIIEHSPTDRVRARDLIGAHEPRTRVLNDEEIRSLWKSWNGSQFGLLCQLLLTTGARRSEIAGSRRSEINGDVLTIPPERFKSKSTHMIPLSPLAQLLIAKCPQDDRLFRLKGFSKAKRRIDTRAGVTGYTLHDLRRTVRTRLSALKVPYEVAELIIGHSKRGLARVYDQHEYADEMRDALGTWAICLQGIVRVSPYSPRE